VIKTRKISFFLVNFELKIDLQPNYKKENMSFFNHKNYNESFVCKYDLVKAAEAIREGYKNIAGEYPSDKAAAKLLAQSRLETGHFSFCYNHNWGNVKRHPDKGQFHMIRCNEMIDGVYKWFDPPHIQTCFAAYETKEEGAHHWMNLIMTGKRYERAREALNDDSVSAYDFCWVLGTCGYYTADKKHYSSVAQSLFATSLENVIRSRGGEPEEKGRVLRLVMPLMEGEDVEKWQKSLRMIYPEIEVDGIYGQKTEEITRKFQKKNNIPVDGVVGPTTLNMIEYVIKNIPDPERLLRLRTPSMQGSDVMSWQSDLADAGYTIKVDGWFGKETDSQTKNFQRNNGLVDDGIVGPKTRSKMEEILEE
jgi:hypothetical protein